PGLRRARSGRDRRAVAGRAQSRRGGGRRVGPRARARSGSGAGRAPLQRRRAARRHAGPERRGRAGGLRRRGRRPPERDHAQRGGCDRLGGERFGGALDGLKAARAATTAPLLAKGFFTEELDLRKLKVAGAEAALVILRDVDDQRAAALLSYAHELGIETLVEAHDAND